VFGAPALLICVGVKAPIATDPVCGVDIHFADQIRQLAIPGNHAVLAGLNFTKVSTGFNLAEVHPTATTWFQGLRLEAVEEFRALACTRQPDGIRKSVVFNDKNITLGGEQAVNALAVGPPRIMVITLLRIKSRCFQNIPGKRAKKDIDVSEILGILLRLLEIAVMPCESLGEEE
jgi:hypothetical protein